jgi:hypothetical protein
VNRQQLNEGLRPLDLKEMVYPTFEVDTFRSKMGEDRDVCVVSFRVKDRAPAKDLMEFIEKGYEFVLDADVSSGENNKGEYSVFVEISRTPKLAEQIKELTHGVNKLTGLKEFKFVYHKDSAIHEATEDKIKSVVPSTSSEYDGLMLRKKTNEVRNFFSKTLMDDLTLDDDIITIHKPFEQKIKLRIVKEGETESILEGIQEPILADEGAISEVFWLTKVIGDYAINKIGDQFVFNNGNKAMILQRIE